jgi:hypothetical protein
MASAFLSLIILIMGIGLFPELTILWVILAVVVWLPAWLFFGAIVLGIAILTVL